MIISKVYRYVLIILFAILLILGFLGYKISIIIMRPNVKNEAIFTIPDGATFEQVLDSIKIKDILINEKSFIKLAKYKKYPSYIKKGKYSIRKGQTSNQIINMLLSGNQVPVRVIFNNLRFTEQLAERLSEELELDSADFMNYISTPELYTKYGFDKNTFRAMFIPNTYQIYWTVTPEEFVERMSKEYKIFWSDIRLEKAEKIGLSPVQVITLASIVQEETAKQDEMPMVAGLYINRLNKGMFLQADPTVKYAIGDFSIRRVLNIHLNYDSPYNTYKYTGLPPGPINFPEVSSIDAVLNHTQHKYLFMCAKEDFSGYHNFAISLSEHNANARRYRSKLNEKNIYK